MLLNEQPNFRYEALPNLDNWTRLLHVLPGAAETAIHCQLYNVTLTDQPAYETLSYEWGKPGDTSVIQVNGQKFVVRKNLFSFLQQVRAYRARSAPVVIWVDAICINQNDIDEKNNQVRRMHEIYSQAGSCIAFLGEGTPESVNAFNTIGDWIEEADESRIEAITKPYYPREVWIEETKERYFPPGVIDGMWEAIAEVYKLSYWTRAWIVQEILLSRTVAFVHGTRYISKYSLDLLFFAEQLFQALTSTKTTYRTRSDETSVPKPTEAWQDYQVLTDVFKQKRLFDTYLLPNPARSIVHTFGDTRGAMARGQPLWDCVSDYSTSRCHELHDKVYAYLGLAIKYQELVERGAGSAPFKNFKVDYQMSLLEVVAYALSYSGAENPITFAESLLRTVELIDPAQALYDFDRQTAGRLGAEALAATQRLGLRDSVNTPVFYMGPVHLRSLFRRHRTKTFWVEGFEYNKLVGDRIQNDDLAFLLERTDIVVICREAKGQLLSVALAAPVWRTYKWPASLVLSATIAPPTSLERTSFTPYGYANFENIVKADVSLTIVQIILIAAQTTVEDYSEWRKATDKLLENQNRLPKFLARLGIKDMGPWDRYEFSEGGYRFTKTELLVDGS